MTTIATTMGPANDCDKDAKTTSIPWERQAATVPQVPLYFFGHPNAVRSGAVRRFPPLNRPPYSSPVLVDRKRNPVRRVRPTNTIEESAAKRYVSTSCRFC